MSLNTRFGGLAWITKGALDLNDVHEHVKSMVVPDFQALTEEHKVPYLPAAAIGAIAGKLTGAGIGSIKKSPWTGSYKFEPSWRGSGWGYTIGGVAGAGAGVLAAALINKIRGEEKKKRTKGQTS